MRETRFVALAVAVALPALMAGCTDLGVGSTCRSTTEVMGEQISAPALDCVSRLCYLAVNTADNNRLSSYCTARCASDADCAGGKKGTGPGECPSEFVCAVASAIDIKTSTQHFACQTLCLCKDDLKKGFNANYESPPKACCPNRCDNTGDCPAFLPKCSAS